MDASEATRTDEAAAMTSGRAEVRRAGVWMLAGNLVLSAVKSAAGWFGGSRAVLADGVHSLADTVTDLAIVVGVEYWSQPADAAHPHGHRRIETIVTLGIGLSLAGVAVGVAWSALASLADGGRPPPGWLAFWAAVLSLVCKEGMYRWCIRVGRRLRSSALVANAWHHRSDAWSSLPAALAVLGARLLPGMRFLDAVGAVVVSLVILQAAWEVLRPVLAELTDRAASDRVEARIADLAHSVAGVRRVHAVRTRRMGGAVEADLHVLVDGDLPVRDGHAISERVKARLLEDGPDVVDAVVHLEPDDPTHALGPPDPPPAPDA